MLYKCVSMRMVCFLIVMMLLIPSVMAEGVTVKAVSYFPYNGNDTVTINLVVNDAGQVVEGTWNGAGLPDGKRLEQPIKFEVRNNIEKLIYPFINQNTLYKYRAYYIVPHDDDESVQCPSKPAFCFPIYTGNFYTWIDKVIVVERQAVGSYSAFGNPDISQNAELIITLNGTEYKQNIGTGQESRGSTVFKTMSGEYIGNAIFTGMSMTGRGAPNQDLYVGTHLIGQSWKIAPKISYESYVKSLTETDIKLAALQSDLPDNFDHEDSYYYNGELKYTACKDLFCTDVINSVITHNAIVDKLTSQNVQIDYRAPTATHVTAISNGNVIDTLNMPIGYSEIALTLNADKIGVIQTSGKPEITNLSIQSYASGDNDGLMRVSLRNVGDARAVFGVRMNGSIEQKITLDSGASGGVEIPFTGTEGINNGWVEAYDLVSGEFATQAYQLIITAPKNFIPNQSQIYNDAELKSDATGMNQTVGKECTGIWQYKDNKYHCIELDDIAEPTPITKEQLVMAVPTMTPEPPYEGTYGFYGWIIAIIMIFLMGGIIVGQMISSRGGRKNLNGALRLILILIVIGAMLVLIVHYLPAIENKINEIQFVMNIMEKLR